jgi:2,3-bisphosphoglycerate-dependent phosphoglycerate mutase
MSEHLEILLMRHGRSRADDEQVIEGRYDAPLTDLGRAQAEARANEFLAAGSVFDAIVASPLKRAHETAEIVGRALDTAVVVDPGWMERDNGPVAGLTVEEAGERYPLPDYLSPFDDLVPTAREGESSGESAWALQARVIRALQRVVQRGPGRSLVVAQGGSLSAALRCVVGAPLAARTRGSGFPWATPGTRDSSSRHGSTAGCSASSDMARINDPPSKTRERT